MAAPFPCPAAPSSAPPLSLPPLSRPAPPRTPPTPPPPVDEDGTIPNIAPDLTGSLLLQRLGSPHEHHPRAECETRGRGRDHAFTSAHEHPHSRYLMWGNKFVLTLQAGESSKRGGQRILFKNQNSNGFLGTREVSTTI